MRMVGDCIVGGRTEAEGRDAMEGCEPTAALAYPAGSGSSQASLVDIDDRTHSKQRSDNSESEGRVGGSRQGQRADTARQQVRPRRHRHCG